MEFGIMDSKNWLCYINYLVSKWMHVVNSTGFQRTQYNSASNVYQIVRIRQNVGVNMR